MGLINPLDGMVKINFCTSERNRSPLLSNNFNAYAFRKNYSLVCAGEILIICD
jgi:hypothetical protein